MTVIWEGKKVQGEILAVSGKFQLESINLLETFHSKWCLSHFNSSDIINILQTMKTSWPPKTWNGTRRTFLPLGILPPTKTFRQNKVCSYFPFAITGAYNAKALVLLHDLQFCF